MARRAGSAPWDSSVAAEVKVAERLIAANERQAVRVLGEDEHEPPPAIEISETSELANARRFVAKHGSDVHFCHELGGWFRWDGARFQRDPGALGVMDLVKTIIPDLYEEAVKKADRGDRDLMLKWAARSEGRRVLENTEVLARSEAGVAVRAEDLDRDPWLLNVSNGTVDLRTGQLGPHERANLITKLAPVEYDPAAKAPTWEAFLERVLPSEALRIFVQRAIGYSLTGDTSEQVLLFCLGPGINGKTTFVEVTQTTLGEYAVRAPFEMFLARDREGGVRNDIARLRGARFVSAVEVEAGRRFSEVVVKELTGGDTVTARHLYSDFFEFVPQFKAWLAGNHKPVIRGTDNAIWRRIRLIPFTVTIPPEEQDRHLPERLRVELPGILAWAVRGCLDWQREGLTSPDEVTKATLEYRLDQDVVGAFVEDSCRVSDTALVPFGLLFDAYRHWCDANGQRPLSTRAFAPELDRLGFPKGVVHGGAKIRRGLCLKPPLVRLDDMEEA